MNLFLSHASEDKPFVEELAEALRNAGHKVWLDKWVLKLGDSLREKIDEGLKECDYGVVVFSKVFFAKKWTNLEVDGLLARETPEKKLFLPVWKDVTEEDVRAFSPILCGRLAADAAWGIATVVEKINDLEQKTIGAVVKNSKGSISARLLKIGSEQKAKLFDEQFKRTSESVLVMHRQTEAVYDEIASTVAEHSNTPGLKLKASRQVNSQCSGGITVYGPYGVAGHIAHGSPHHSTVNAHLQIVIQRASKRRPGKYINNKEMHREEFAATYSEERKVIWVCKSNALPAEKIPEYFLELLISEIERDKTEPPFVDDWQ